MYMGTRITLAQLADTLQGDPPHSTNLYHQPTRPMQFNSLLWATPQLTRGWEQGQSSSKCVCVSVLISLLKTCEGEGLNWSASSWQCLCSEADHAEFMEFRISLNRWALQRAKGSHKWGIIGHNRTRGTNCTIRVLAFLFKVTHIEEYSNLKDAFFTCSSTSIITLRDICSM